MLRLELRAMNSQGVLTRLRQRLHAIEQRTSHLQLERAAILAHVNALEQRASSASSVSAPVRLANYAVPKKAPPPLAALARMANPQEG